MPDSIIRKYLRFNQDKAAEEGEESPNGHKNGNDVGLWLVLIWNLKHDHVANEISTIVGYLLTKVVNHRAQIPICFLHRLNYAILIITLD